MITTRRFLSVVITLTLVSCTNSLPSVVGKRRLTVIESDYKEVVNSENHYDPVHAVPLMKYFKASDAGADLEGDPSGWTNPYYRFSRTVDEIQMSAETHKRLRLYLMSKYGVVSSLVKLPQVRTKCIHYHLSIEDPYAFDLDEIRRRVPKKNLRMTALLRSLLDSPELYK